MRLRSIQWRLTLILILLILLAMEFVGVYLLNSLERYYINAVSSHLVSQGQLLAGFLQRYFTSEPDIEYATRMAREFAQQSRVAIVVLNSSGGLVSTSVGDPAALARFLIPTEVARGLAGSKAEAIRLDPESGERNLHLAVPITEDQRVLGVVYMIGSLEDTYRTLGDIRTILFTATGLAVGVTALVGSALARTITKPIEEVTAGAARMARGRFDQSIQVRGQDEIGQLASMFNFLGNRLKATLDEMEDEKARLETVLNSMTDGIIAAGGSKTVEVVNPAAARFLGVGQQSLVGKTVDEVLDGILEPSEIESATSGVPVLARKTILGRPESRVLQVVSASTQSEREQATSGTVFVLQDVTAQERLDTLRKEFVANVSHELKTPITTIKSYIETLLDGVLSDSVMSRQFLEVVLRETDRMNRLVRDLLDLSRIDYKQVAWDLRPVDPVAMVKDTLQKLKVQADAKQISVIFEPADMPPVLADFDRIQQVALNIFANALEYTPAGGRVSVSLANEGDFVSISVQDTGVGIPEEDLPRVFERFYRVDKARSRQMGGTGLGLAIAKEIIESHGGTIGIQSELGKGTTVTFSLPVDETPADEYE